MLDACRADRHRDSDTLLPRHAAPGERVPRVRRRGREARACSCPSCSRKAEDGHGGPHRLRPRAAQPQAGARDARVVGRSVDHAAIVECISELRSEARAFRSAGAARPRPRAQARRPSRSPRRPDAATVAEPSKVDNELYVRDYAKCMLCYKCVEACGDAHQNTFAIAVAGRGFDAHISTEFAVPLPESACVYCGNCIAVCPTGALMAKREYDKREAGDVGSSRARRRRTRSARTAASAARSRCTCTTARSSRPPRRRKRLTQGNLCIKGRFGFEHVQS